jgi:hypothetical protein
MRILTSLSSLSDKLLDFFEEAVVGFIFLLFKLIEMNYNILKPLFFFDILNSILFLLIFSSLLWTNGDPLPLTLSEGSLVFENDNNWNFNAFYGVLPSNQWLLMIFNGNTPMNHALYPLNPIKSRNFTKEFHRIPSSIFQGETNWILTIPKGVETVTVKKLHRK